MSVKEIPIYNFGAIKLQQLESIVSLKRKLPSNYFKNWFENEIKITTKENTFLKELIEEHYFLIESYNEEELKVKFIAPILNQVKFTNIEYEFRDFYEEKITYKTDDFILTGITDFLVSEGLEYSKKPYFFIQEFKKSIKNDDPRPQLLAELIAAIELNGLKQIKGAYIVGENWNFVILEKLSLHCYQYCISHTFNATHFNNLQQIYKNLCFIKQEIMKIQNKSKK